MPPLLEHIITHKHETRQEDPSKHCFHEGVMRQHIAVVGNIFLVSLGENSIIIFQHIVNKVVWEETRLFRFLWAPSAAFKKSGPCGRLSMKSQSQGFLRTQCAYWLLNESTRLSLWQKVLLFQLEMFQYFFFPSQYQFRYPGFGYLPIPRTNMITSIVFWPKELVAPIWRAQVDVTVSAQRAVKLNSEADCPHFFQPAWHKLTHCII